MKHKALAYGEYLRQLRATHLCTSCCRYETYRGTMKHKALAYANLNVALTRASKFGYHLHFTHFQTPFLTAFGATGLCPTYLYPHCLHVGNLHVSKRPRVSVPRSWKESLHFKVSHPGHLWPQYSGINIGGSEDLRGVWLGSGLGSGRSKCRNFRET